jgi:ATP-dependent Zn protease
MTRMLVRRHRARIERVAEALLAKTKLSAKQVDKVLRRMHPS